MLPIAMFLLQRDSQFLTGHELFLKRVGAAYHAFLDSAERQVRRPSFLYDSSSTHAPSKADLPLRGMLCLRTASKDGGYVTAQS